ncbi:hypothetical protein [Bradyrhizobium sp. WSM1743]|uniref:hypothetical protein n=1 Tax=Bradyrhizobium sp. WSM1743 TaxID=318996 RepID=UPI000486A16B|nr:hypothetical protein [Bradyrhizobium sp. WSM1743]
MDFYLLAWLTSPSRASGVIALGVLAMVPPAIFAASMVRFSFVALALLVPAVLSPRVQSRKVIAAVTALALFAIVGALALRSQTTRVFVDLAFYAAAGAWSTACDAVDRDIRIAIRGRIFPMLCVSFWRQVRLESASMALRRRAASRASACITSSCGRRSSSAGSPGSRSWRSSLEAGA